MGILHEMLAKIHLAHDNALAMADPEAVKTQAHHGFFAEVADLVHALEQRVLVIEHSLFGEPEKAQPAVAENTGSGAAPVTPQLGEASDSAATTSAAAGTATPSA